jgi:hypothetical protein
VDWHCGTADLIMLDCSSAFRWSEPTVNPNGAAATYLNLKLFKCTIKRHFLISCIKLKRFSRHLYKKIIFLIHYMRSFYSRTSKLMEVNIDLAQWNQG